MKGAIVVAVLYLAFWCAVVGFQLWYLSLIIRALLKYLAS